MTTLTTPKLSRFDGQFLFNTKRRETPELYFSQSDFCFVHSLSCNLDFSFSLILLSKLTGDKYPDRNGVVSNHFISGKPGTIQFTSFIGEVRHRTDVNRHSTIA